MTWPIKEETIDAIDWSWYQQGSDGSFIDVDQFVAQNPNVKMVMLRAVWPNGVLDSAYPYFMDAFAQYPDIIRVAYLWPNPLRTDVLARWTTALETPVARPQGLMLDFELTFHQTDDVLTDNAEQAFQDVATFDLPYFGYTRGNWWQQHIKTTVEKNRMFVIAHYPYFLIRDKWQQSRNHGNLHTNLPIHNNFTPALGRIKPEQVLGWQFSDRGKLSPHAPHAMDLDSMLKDRVNAMFREEVPDPTPPPADEITINYSVEPEGTPLVFQEV